MSLSVDKALRQAQSHLKNGELAEAESLYKQVLSKFPKNKKAIQGYQKLKTGITLKGSLGNEPPQEQIDELISLYSQGQFEAVLSKAKPLLGLFPKAIILYNLQGASNAALRRNDAAIYSYRQAIKIKPAYADTYSNMGNTLKNKGELDAAIENYKQAIKIKPDHAEAYNNMGNAFKDKGELDKAINCQEQALKIKPDYAEAYFNMGIALQDRGDLEKAIDSYNQAIRIKPDHAQSYWNLSGTSVDILGAKDWLTKCLEADNNHTHAKLTLAALNFYQGDEKDFNNLINSSLWDHPYTRSFSWVFSLPKLPKLYFDRWPLFDFAVQNSIASRPFYEYGVFRGAAFKYLIKTLKKGYGFDTFEGLPEDWHTEKSGTYSSDGNIPKVDGGQFIVGKFEETLPEFFSIQRPMASVINFDADLYSSTICALNYSKSVMDHNTVLIFDEFIINDHWEEDEYKALEEFCTENNFGYEVIALSFFTKQVAVKLINYD